MIFQYLTLIYIDGGGNISGGNTNSSNNENTSLNNDDTSYSLVTSFTPPIIY